MNRNAAPESSSASPNSKAENNPGAQYSGMYSFLKEGEFVQVTVEEAGPVTGFVSRYGDLESDKSLCIMLCRAQVCLFPLLPISPTPELLSVV